MPGSTPFFVVLFTTFLAVCAKNPIAVREGELRASSLFKRQNDTGTLPGCRLNYQTTVWTGCADILRRFNITLDYFRLANPTVSAKCANFVPGDTYCIRRASGPGTSRVKVSTDGLCGAQRNWTSTCVGSRFGDCCGAGGYCGAGEDYCGIGNCQEGSCDGGQPYSTDGRCGKEFDYLLCPPKFGSCCSASGYCGSTSEYCGVGCQNGPCLSSATAASTSSAVAATTPAPFSLSTDGTCGFKQQLVCAGSTFGNCCSAAGYCGSKQYHCSSLLGCQPAFGSCDKSESSISNGTAQSAGRT